MYACREEEYDAGDESSIPLSSLDPSDLIHFSHRPCLLSQHEAVTTYKEGSRKTRQRAEGPRPMNLTSRIWSSRALMLVVNHAAFSLLSSLPLESAVVSPSHKLAQHPRVPTRTGVGLFQRPRKQRRLSAPSDELILNARLRWSSSHLCVLLLLAL
jgi:hypothetical protein